MSEVPGRRLTLFAGLLILVILQACAPRPGIPPAATGPATAEDPIAALLQETPGPPLEEMKFSVQVGAFSQLANAVRLEEELHRRGVDAYSFRDDSGLYKVRFGNHDDYDGARRSAETLQRQGMIAHFFIVIPEQYAAARIRADGRGDLREELVRTVRRYLGVPYLWGGESTDGFDCSGLTMVSYRINGLNLPRNSRSQYRSGTPVARHELQKGDLVFFATKGGTRVTHVGMYVGDGKFIHAPRTGKTVRVASLNNSFFARTYVGARTYL